MSKQSSYQKMKAKKDAKIQELINDILILVKEEDFATVRVVKMKWKISIDLEKAIWA